ncbi:18261_t:CDS:1, partial [Gigaspora rosea]
GLQLRELFAMILLRCTPTYPEKLWLSFRTNICDDLSYHLRNIYAIEEPTENQIFDYGLFLIDKILQKSNRSLTNYPKCLFGSAIGLFIIEIILLMNNLYGT